MDLESKAKKYSFFSIETSDEKLFARVCARVVPSKKDTHFDEGSESEGFRDYFCVNIEGTKRLMSALRDERGNYKVYARKRKEDRKSRLIYENIEGQAQFSE